MLVTIRVVPGSSRAAVGGSRGVALVVRVSERAVDGKATEAALRAVAAALEVARRDVVLVRGATSRDKILDVAGNDEVLADRLADLRGRAP